MKKLIIMAIMATTIVLSADLTAQTTARHWVAGPDNSWTTSHPGSKATCPICHPGATTQRRADQPTSTPRSETSHTSTAQQRQPVTTSAQQRQPVTTSAQQRDTTQQRTVDRAVSWDRHIRAAQRAEAVQDSIARADPRTVGFHGKYHFETLRSGEIKTWVWDNGSGRYRDDTPEAKKIAAQKAKNRKRAAADRAARERENARRIRKSKPKKR